MYCLSFEGMFLSDSPDKDDDDILTVLMSVWRAERCTCRNVMLLHPKTDSVSIKMHRKTETPWSQSCIHWAPCFLSDPAQQGIWFMHSSLSASRFVSSKPARSAVITADIKPHKHPCCKRTIGHPATLGWKSWKECQLSALSQSNGISKISSIKVFVEKMLEIYRYQTCTCTVYLHTKKIWCKLLLL